MGQEEARHGAGQAHIEQSPFFLDAIHRVLFQGAAMGNQFLFATGDEHIGKLQTLGRMQGHQLDRVFRALIGIGVADQGNVLQKSGQLALGIQAVVFLGVGQEFLHVGVTVHHGVAVVHLRDPTLATDVL